MSCFEPPENIHPLDWLLTDCDNNLDSFSGGDPIAANQPPEPEPDFFDLHFGSKATNRSERSLADVPNGLTGSAGPVLPGAGGFTGGAGAMLSEEGAGAPEYSLGTLAGFGGGVDAADAWLNGGSYKSTVGSGPLSKAATYLNAANTLFTHEPNVDGTISSLAERMLMGATDLSFGLAGGPYAVADAMTGSNLAGGLKILADGAFVGADALLTGNNRSLFNFERSIDRGNFGSAASWLSQNSPFALYDYGPTIAQQREMDRDSGE